MLQSRRWHAPAAVYLAFASCLATAAGKASGGNDVSPFSPAINVALQASFNKPPYILELLETAAEENNTCYYPLLDVIASGRFSQSSSDAELYNAFRKTLIGEGHINSAEGLSSFDLALAIHSTAPRIEAHYQYYDSTIEPTQLGGMTGKVQDGACAVWIALEGKQYCSSGLERPQQDLQHDDVEELAFDRVLERTVAADPGSEEVPAIAPEAILYADVTHPTFALFHTIMSDTAKDGKIKYRLRYRRPPILEEPDDSSGQEYLGRLGESHKKLRITGYGVELALKRTDYIVIDDRKKDDKAEGDTDDAAKERRDEEGKETADDEALIGSQNTGAAPSLDDILNEEINDLKPLTASQLSGLGLKTAAFIMSSADPFETLIKVSQDFPKYSSAISSWNVSRELLREHRANREKFVPAGYNIVWINGQQVQARQMDAFSLLTTMRRERRLVSNLRALGLNGTGATNLLSHPAIAQAAAEGDAQRYIFTDENEGGKVIIWMNDLQKDKRYSSWDPRTSGLLQRTWPGQLPQVRQNIHNMVMPVDFSDVADLQLVVETLQMIVKRALPIRIGLVPLLPTVLASQHAKVAYYLQHTYGLAALLAYLESALEAQAALRKKSFIAATKDRVQRSDRMEHDFEQIIEGDSDKVDSEHIVKEWGSISGTKAYLERLGIEKLPAPFLVNGAVLPRTEAWLQVMGGRIDQDFRTLQRLVYTGQLKEDAVLEKHFLQNAALRRNPFIVPESENDVKIIDVAEMQSAHREIIDQLPTIPASAAEGGYGAFAPQVFVVADFDSPAGVSLLTEVLKFKARMPQVELKLVHNPSDAQVPFRSVALHLHTRAQGGKMLLDELDEKVKGHSSPDDFNDGDRQQAKTFWRRLEPFVHSVGLTPGQQGYLVNGRLVGPVPAESSFYAEDFQLLLQYEGNKRVKPVEAALAALSYSDLITSPSHAAVLTSAVALSSMSDVPEGIFDSAPAARMSNFQEWKADQTVIKTGEPDSSSIHIVASIDPTSSLAQRWIAILRVLSEMDGVTLRLFLNPKERIQELPITRFYRHVLDSKPSFTAEGELAHPEAQFKGVPKEALLNLAMDVPPAWLVAPRESIHDLDNIKLSAVPQGTNVDALYELESVLIEGHSRDMSSGAPPRGVQLVLGTDKNPHFADTIIMANVGYFQFHANPGHWRLRLQTGPSSDIYNIDSAGQEGYMAVPGDESTDITLMSFQGKTLYPRLSRKPGKETDDVLDEGTKGGTLGSILARAGANSDSVIGKASKFASSWMKKRGLSSLTGSHLTAIQGAGKQADINIFSVASGHLYERMLSIMMVSVMRHTKHSVKFWFIEQFLSPSFKASLPTLAAHYGFDYSLITYKWPHWLRPQTEKQREIWGYKILFLDVLFPLSLDKVIFVDADQIVRTDMYELISLELPEGTPYGFTPMCDSRTEMEGFRFWKQGYWANFLRGKPYHISALYVVDLVRFRALAAGDRMRQQYQSLSADPGSLSNLDQDLPNHMQHVLPIHSLPQDWLWCETWCSDEALTTAKTIDLCNNPLTKEPKLKRARRQVPEWTVYDDEIASVLAAAASSAKNATAGDARGPGAVAHDAIRAGGVQEAMIEGSPSPAAEPAKDEL